MSGSGPIYEYQRELTAKLEQVMRERDEARAARDHFKEQLRERAEALLDARAEIERFRNAVREKERLELAAVQELDEARACLAFERVTVTELKAEVARLRLDTADLLARLDAAAFAVQHGIREVAEKQREACANYLHVWRYDPSKGARSWDECDAVRATPLVTEDEK